MAKVTYEVVEHEGGWAYRLDGAYSETFPTRDDAHRAAERVAQEQRAPGETSPIDYQDARGRWHHETSQGADRPATEVSDQDGPTR